AELKPDAVVAGSEWGVTYAEELAHRLGLPTNRFDTIGARRDKFNMIEAVRARGLHAARQARVATLAEAHDLAEHHGAWRIVVRPLASAGWDGVAICRSHGDIDVAFRRSFGRENFMGGFNDHMLLQSYLAGPQFIVNTVSWDGRHYVTDVWSMILSVEGRDVVPGGIHLLDPRGPKAEGLIRYTLEVLDALGIENGAAHTELKWTPEGPAPTEPGAGLRGAGVDAPSSAAAGRRSQANVFAGLLDGSAESRDLLFARKTYGLRRHMTKLLFNFQADGKVRSTGGLARLGE